MATNQTYEEPLLIVTEDLIDPSKVDVILRNTIGDYYHAFVDITYNFTRQVTKENDGLADGPVYRGGQWSFYALSNGGIYLLPPHHDAKQIRARLESNGADVILSNQALGLAASSFALSNLAFALSKKGLEEQAELVSESFYALRDFYMQHQESFEISTLLD